eukprot:scaffold1238_cov116-Isochrysis_galbana.AAC.4
MDYYAPDYKLHVPVSNMENENTPAMLLKTKVRHGRQEPSSPYASGLGEIPQAGRGASALAPSSLAQETLHLPLTRTHALPGCLAQQKLFEALSQLEHAPNVGIQTGNPGTRLNPDTLNIDSEEDEEEWDLRPQRNRRQHLAEYFDEDDAEGDLLDTDRLGLHDFEEPPSDDDHL